MRWRVQRRSVARTTSRRFSRRASSARSKAATRDQRPMNGGRACCACRATRRSIACIGVAVVPLDRERVLEAQTVLIEGDRIRAVGPASSLVVPKGARVIDGKGRYLLPGLADMHTHLVREEDLALYLARGVTTVRN